MIDEKDKCPSCGKLYIMHDGIIRTCAELIETKARLDGAVKLLREARTFEARYGESDLADFINAFLAEGGK